MPEGPEAEIWRSAAEAVVGRVITDVWFDDRVGPSDLADALVGRRVTATHRHGKVVVVDTDGPSLGLHFGMTGRLVVDGRSPIEKLTYASGADRPDWDRLRLSTGSATPALRMNDPRRLGRLSLDPDLSHLGPDAFTVSARELVRALRRRTAPIKSVLLDQKAISGLGNLCADEVLFWSGISPARPADEIDESEVATIATWCRDRLAALLESGGSTTGLLDPSTRSAVPSCPWDDAAMTRESIGGRTAVWCPRHQR